MTDFDYDCLQRKKLAAQARYRRRGNKSKKCTLLSDRLTQKQWKERCGPLITYNLNQPMYWADFKNLPVDVQTDYITNLQNKYGATAIDLGNMFGVRALAVRKHVESHDLDVKFCRGRAMSAENKVEWQKFLDGDIFATTESEENVAIEETCAEEPVETNVVPDADKLVEPVSEKRDAMKMKKFSLQFSGTLDAGAIANSLRLILGDRSDGELEITCSLV